MPFTREQFFQTIADYDLAVGPLVWLLYAGALFALYEGVRGSERRSRWILGFLSFLWAWMAIVYHWGFFSKINPAARLFGVLFLAQAFVFAWAAFRNWRVTLAPARSVKGAVQWFLFAYALVIYPLLGVAFNHGYPNGPIFGLPCPTTIFTMVFVSALGSRRKVIEAGAIPVLWALIGTSAASLFGVTEDLMLGVSALLLVLSVVFANSTANLRTRHA